MKKLLSLVLALAMVFCLAACGESSGDGTTASASPADNKQHIKNAARSQRLQLLPLEKLWCVWCSISLFLLQITINLSLILRPSSQIGYPFLRLFFTPFKKFSSPSL